MADPKRDEGFKVVDRRLFTEEGELRKEVVEQERREEEVSAKKTVNTPPEKLQTSAPEVPGNTGLADELGSAASTDKEEIPASRNFQMLVDFLTRNAAAMLGGMADPRTGQAFLDLEGAREMIDMLDVLREKTKGNLARADEDLLIEVVGSLKLTYLELSKAAAEQLKKQAGIKK